MLVRKTTRKDFLSICRMYAGARKFMRQTGNLEQWQGGYPSYDMMIADIDSGNSYVCVNTDNDSADSDRGNTNVNNSNANNNDSNSDSTGAGANGGNAGADINQDEIAAVFYFCVEDEPTYNKIGGRWLSDETYGVVHRLASSRKIKGAGEYCMRWCFDMYPNIKVDTHEDNAPMRGLLQKLGYEYCGTVWMENGAERRAYQKIDANTIISPDNVIQ